jgi:hypothetical protein
VGLLGADTAVTHAVVCLPFDPPVCRISVCANVYLLILNFLNAMVHLLAEPVNCVASLDPRSLFG